MAAKLDTRKLALALGAVVVPGLALLAAVGLKTGKLSFRGSHKASAGTVAPSPIGRPMTALPDLTPAAEPTHRPAGSAAPADAKPLVVKAPPKPKPITREDCLERVGEFVRLKIGAENKHGRHLAREVGELVAELDRTGRIPAREARVRTSAAPETKTAAAGGRRPGIEPPAEVPAKERVRRQNETLGVFAVEQVRSGKQSVALGDALVAELAHLRRQEAAELAAADKARAERLAADEKLRLAAEERQRLVEERRLARRSGRAVRSREQPVAQVAVTRPAVRQPARPVGID